MKHVLYVSGSTAHWVYFKHRKVVGIFEESIEFEENEPYQSKRPANSDATDVHLLVDCARSEIDAHPLLQTGSSWSHRADKSALEKRLNQQFPDAIIRNPAKKSQLDAVLVQHINLPSRTVDWLSHVESSGVTVCSITTVAELLAEQWSSGIGCIVLSSAAGLVRHTYCQSGHALFTRAVSYADKNEFVEQFNQTLSHLHSSSLVKHTMPVHWVGLLEEWVCDLSSLDLVGELNSISTENDSFPIWLAKQLQSSPTIHTNNRHRTVTFALNKSIQRGVRKTQIQRYAMLGVLMVASLGFTVSNEWQRTGEHEQYTVRTKQLKLAIDLYQKKVAALSPQADVLADALQDKLAIESMVGISPAILLTILGQAFTQYRELELQELSWVVVESSDLTTQKQPSVTKVTLSGRLSVSESLRVQQNRFNEFTAHLEVQSELSELEVLQTPLMQFDGTSPDSVGDSMRKPTFELQFNFNRPISNEA